MTVLWGSTTSGIGVRSLELLESHAEGLFSIVISYNADKKNFWRNVANSPASEDPRHSDVAHAPVVAPPPAACRKHLQR
jgi:hypothetical protein